MQFAAARLADAETGNQVGDARSLAPATVNRMTLDSSAGASPKVFGNDRRVIVFGYPSGIEDSASATAAVTVFNIVARLIYPNHCFVRENPLNLVSTPTPFASESGNII